MTAGNARRRCLSFCWTVVALGALLATPCMFGHSARAEDWPCFRGPTGMGQSSHRDIPTRWGGEKNENIQWRILLVSAATGGKADHNQSSPIVVGQDIIVCTTFWPAGSAQSQVPEQHVTCYRTSDGAMRWDTLVPAGPWLLTDLRGGYGAPTPAGDGERIYAAFGSATLAALDMDGRLQWQQKFDDSSSIDVAYATSPVIYQGHPIVLCDKNNQKSVLVCFDRATGKPRWSQSRPQVAFNHSTPVLATINGASQLLVAASNALQGIDPADGSIRWWCSTPGDVTSPVFDGKWVYIDSGRGGPGMAVDPNGSGDVSGANVRWRVAQIPEGLSSPVIVRGLLFRTHSPGVLKCLRMDDGQPVFSTRLDGISTQASPIATADGLVYLASGGRSLVLRAGESLDILATNDLNDPSAASPAVADGRLYIKGGRYLYCIAAPE